MRFRWILILLFAAAILGRTFHCLSVEARIASLALQTANAEIPPLENSNDVDPNESCCICKGAIVPPLVTAQDAGLLHWLDCPLAVVQTTDRWVVSPAPNIGRSYDQYLLGPPPLGGRALRALTHLLLI